MNNPEEKYDFLCIIISARKSSETPETLLPQRFEHLLIFRARNVEKWRKRLIIDAALFLSTSTISTVSTLFSTKKSLILLEKTRLCGKLYVESSMHTKFSTYGTIVENHVVFVENSWKVLSVIYVFCHLFVTFVNRFGASLLNVLSGSNDFRFVFMRGGHRSPARQDKQV